MDKKPLTRLTEYDLYHLAEHLEDSAQAIELHRLLALETDGRQNAWFEAKESIDDLDGFQTDVERAWELAARSQDDSDRDRSYYLGLQTRYALIKTSIHSFATEVPPDLIVSLLQIGQWTPTKALAYIRQLPDPSKRVKSVAVLVPHLPPSLQGRPIQLALDDVKQVEDSFARAESLVAIVPYLPDHLLGSAMSIADGVSWDSQPDVLSAVASRWATLGFLEQAVAVVESNPIDYFKIKSLIDILPLLPVDQRIAITEEILRRIAALKSPGDEINAFVRLVPYLPLSERSQAIVGTFELAINQDPRWRHATALTKLLPYLSELKRERAIEVIIEAARNSTQPQDQARFLLDVIPHLNFEPDSVPDFLVVILENTAWQTEILAALAYRLAELGYPEHALEKVQRIASSKYRAKALAILLPRLPRELADKATSEMLDSLHTIDDERVCLEVLTKISPQLTGAHLEQAIEIGQSLEFESPRAQVLSLLSQRCPQPRRTHLLFEALDAARSIRDEYWQVEPLVSFSMDLPTAERTVFMEIAYQKARQVRRKDWCARAFSSVAPHLNPPMNEYAFSEALSALEGIETISAELNTYAQLAQELPLSLHEKALNVARTYRGSNMEAHLLVRIGPHLQEPAQTLVLRETLAIANRFDPFLQLQLLNDAMNFYPITMLEDVLTCAKHMPSEIEDLGGRRVPLVEILTGMAFRLSGEARNARLEEALHVAHGIGDVFWVQTLASVCRHLPELRSDKLVNEALSTSVKIESDVDRAIVLGNLAAWLAEPALSEIYQEAMELIRNVDSFQRLSGIRVMIRSIPDNLLPDLINISSQITQPDYRAEALIHIVPRLEQPERTRTLENALHDTVSVGYFMRRERLLSLLVPLLVELEAETLIPLWRRALVKLASRERRGLLNDLQYLRPIIGKLGGLDATYQAAADIVNITRWWL